MVFLCLSPSLSVVCMQLKEMNHDNINPFVGACVEPGHICYLMQCCSRGTVQVSRYGIEARMR